MAAPRYVVSSWQTEQGLPQNSVISMTQSPEGYLWLATFNGLVRFDGARFVVFNSQNTPALDSSRIVRLWHDREGVLWIGTESGGVIRRAGNSFERLHVVEGKALLALCDGMGRGEVWFTHADGTLYRFSNGKVETASSRENGFLMMPFMEKERLFVFSGEGMTVRSGTNFSAVTDAGLQHPNSGDVFLPARNGGWWRSYRRRVALFQNDSIVKDLGGPAWLKARAATLFEDSKSNLWIGTLGAGAVRVDAAGEKEVISEQYGLGHAQVRSIFEDREGNIWLGTDGAGLHRLRKSVFSVVDKSDGLGADVTLAVTEDVDGVWVGSNGGGLTKLKKTGLENYFTENIMHVWTVLPTADALWVGTWGKGLRVRRGERFGPATALAGLGDIVVASYKGADGTLWFGGAHGLASWKNGEVRIYTTKEGLSHDDVRAMVEDGEGGLWIGTAGGGLNRLKDGKFTALRRKDGLSAEVVWSLHRDAEGALWIGTFGGGLNLLRGGKVRSFTIEDGFPSDVICSITEDEAGELWITSYNGVFRVSKKELINYERGRTEKLDVASFTRADGLPSSECTGGFQPSACRTRDGRFFFSTVKGLAILDPKTLEPNSIAPPVFIEEAEVDGTVQTISDAKEFTIKPGAQQIQFRYTALSFSAPEKILFRYKLIGLDKGWQEAGNRRAAYFSHIPPGDYKLQVIACNNDGVWNRAGAVLAVKVIPAMWQTAWFKTLCILLAGGGLFGAIRYVEIRKLHRRMELLEREHAVERERSRIARDIHDDLGASLTQITLLSALAKTDLSRPAEAEAHIREISGTAQELTRSMDEIVWAINPQNDTLEDLLTYTVKFAQEHLKLAKIRCRVDAPANLPPLHLSAEARHNLFLAIKEAINNVAKHSKATEACLRLMVSEEGFIFEIEDNGVGVRAYGDSRNGLGNMERRLRDIGGRFEMMKGAEGGTVVRLHVKK